MLQIFGYLSGLFVLFSAIPYIRDIFLHKTKPQRATWLIYSVLGGISFFSQLAEGATFSLWLTGADTAYVMLTFLLSLSYGVGGYTKKDMRALAAAAGALLAWYLTKEAAVALYIIIAIDAIGTWLTVEKAYQDPKSETFSAWALCAVAGLFSTLAVGKMDIVLLSYPAYILLANAAVAGAILLGKRRQI